MNGSIFLAERDNSLDMFFYYIFIFTWFFCIFCSVVLEILRYFVMNTLYLLLIYVAQVSWMMHLLDQEIGNHLFD
jgi:hypothetical protein